VLLFWTKYISGWDQTWNNAL